jgi:cyanophycin synthetase
VEASVKSESFALENELREATRINARTELGPSTRTIVEAAERLNGPWQCLDEACLIRLDYGKTQKFIAAAMTG